MYIYIAEFLRGFTFAQIGLSREEFLQLVLQIRARDRSSLTDSPEVALASTRMATSASGSKSLKEYLKRYESTVEQEKKKKKKKKKNKPRTDAARVLVVDEDPVWQKPVNLSEEENTDDSADEAKPQIDEDIEVKRMRRLELLRSRRPYHSISDDGSGWVSLSSKSFNLVNQNADMSPPRLRSRNDTPSPEHGLESCGPADTALSPPCRRRQDTPSPGPVAELTDLNATKFDMSLPRRKRVRHDSASPQPSPKQPLSGKEYADLSPPRQQLRRMSSPERSSIISDVDISPPRRRRATSDAPSSEPHVDEADFGRKDTDLSPPRQHRRRHSTPPDPDFDGSDLALPRRSQKGRGKQSSPDHPTERLLEEIDVSLPSASDLSPPRKSRKNLSGSVDTREGIATGLISGKDISKDTAKIKKDEWLRFNALDASITGKGAEGVYRDKLTGKRLSKEEVLKSRQKVEEKPKEKKLEWGKGLAQKREAEERLQELESEKDKPFARTRDDPELDKMLKERVRWGDPMAHLVKKKHVEPALADFGDDEKMKESGFVIPQDIPSHSWLKRGLDAAPNRYGIRPGRHWDGVDRSTGYEKELFKRMNEKRASEREAYLWSVSDM
ncbi:BUD13 homolog isoform X2 [Rhodamnia argentea]|uniref:BUD13 homolog isoform X2 n=1 Tax=Rhodamnia argentea TaxID=178133 RepID=A0A8B8Q8Z6_9MYRT|nr:BUD13 homolog isoform X2 [Rhodamnia argentea]